MGIVVSEKAEEIFIQKLNEYIKEWKKDSMKREERKKELNKVAELWRKIEDDSSKEKLLREIMMIVNSESNQSYSKKTEVRLLALLAALEGQLDAERFTKIKSN